MHALDYLNGTSETVQTLGWPTVQCGEQLTLLLFWVVLHIGIRDPSQYDVEFRFFFKLIVILSEKNAILLNCSVLPKDKAKINLT
jgi:hypothetical protein